MCRADAPRVGRRADARLGCRVPVEPLLFLIVVAVVANLVVMAVLVIGPTARGRPAPRRSHPGRAVRPDQALAAAAVIGGSEDEPTGRTAPTRAYDRIVRVVGWVFILATLVIVGVSGPVAGEPGRDPGPARDGRPVPARRPRHPAGRRSSGREVRRRGLGRGDRGDAARRPDRWRAQPVLLHLSRSSSAGRRSSSARRSPSALTATAALGYVLAACSAHRRVSARRPPLRRSAST